MNPRNPFPTRGYGYRVCARSGLITLITAAAADEGQVFSFRWDDADLACLVNRVRCQWQTVTAFTTGQELGLEFIRVTPFTVRPTSGTDVLNTKINVNKDQDAPLIAAASVDIDISTTAKLTPGTGTLAATPFATGGKSEVTAEKETFVVEFDGSTDFGGPLVLKADEGFLIRNLVLMGAAGTARLHVEVDFTPIQEDAIR